MKTRREIEKHYEFVKLCSRLTKQGFNFSLSKNFKYSLIFNISDAKRLINPETKTPFVISFIQEYFNNKEVCYSFKQWSDRTSFDEKLPLYKTIMV